MGTTWRRSHKDQGPKAKQRRGSALLRLETQLKKGTKPVDHVKNVFVEYGATELLTEQDRKRITKEISILKSKV